MLNGLSTIYLFSILTSILCYLILNSPIHKTAILNYNFHATIAIYIAVALLVSFLNQTNYINYNSFFIFQSSPILSLQKDSIWIGQLASLFRFSGGIFVYISIYIRIYFSYPLDVEIRPPGQTTNSVKLFVPRSLLFLIISIF